MNIAETAPTLRPQHADTVPARPRGRSEPKPRSRRIQPQVMPSGRTAEGRRLREFRASLVQHVGGNPTTAQQALIAATTVLQMQITRMDVKAFRNSGMSEHDSRVYYAALGALRRNLQALGLESRAAPKQPDAYELIANIQAAHRGR